MKPGKDANKALDSLIQDAPNWLVHNSSDVKEPERIKDWRMKMSLDGLDTSVVSLHELNCSQKPFKKSIDQVVFERWIELIGQPFLPKSPAEAKLLLNVLSGKLGEKYLIFKQRAEEKAKKQEAKAKQRELSELL